jgi:hypothetical protein
VAAAVIAFIGVLVGAMLTGLVTSQIEGRKRRLTALRGGRLIASELRVVSTLLTVNADQGQWWTGELPTREWTTHNPELATDIDEETLDHLTGTYAAIGTLTEARALARTAAEPSAKPTNIVVALVHRSRLREPVDSTTDSAAVVPSKAATARFKAIAGRVDESRQKLESQLSAISSRQAALPRILNRSAVAVLIMAVLVLAAYAFYPRAELSTATVAEALRQQLGTDAVVDCDPAGDDWACQVYSVTRTSSSCQTSRSFGASADALPRMKGLTARELVVTRSFTARAAPACTANVEKHVAYQVSLNGSDLLAVPQRAAAAHLAM